MTWPTWTDAGHMASALSFLLAFWLARRTLASERPRMKVYGSRILEAHANEQAAQIGALIEVTVINLSRTANAIAGVEIALMRGDAMCWAPDGDRERLDDGRTRLDLGQGIRWSTREELARIPLTIPGHEALRFVLFVVGPAMLRVEENGLYKYEEWGQIVEGGAAFDPRDLASNALVVDIHDNTYYEPDPEEGVETSRLEDAVAWIRYAPRRLARKVRRWGARGAKSRGSADRLARPVDRP